MFETFEEFLSTARAQIPVVWFIVNLSLTAVLSQILSKIYILYGISLSNRRSFSRNFLLIAMTTMFIITIVKSSLALSLGLVGALSIIRFRAAIKEPEELAYLFLAIAIGLGLGANQGVITCLAFVIIILAIILTRRLRVKVDDHNNLHLSIISENPKDIVLNDIVNVLKKYCAAVDLKRFDETDKILEVSFSVDFDDFTQLNKAKIELQKIDGSLNITLLDSKTIF